MRHLISFDLKRYIRQPKTWAMAGLMVIISLVYLSTCLQKKYSSNVELEGMAFQQLADIFLADSKLVETFPETASSLRVLKETGTKARLEIYSSNKKEYNRLTTFGYLLLAKDRAEKSGKLRALAFKLVAKDMWDDVAEGRSYDSLTFEGANFSFIREDYYQFLMRARLHYELYQKNLDFVDKNHIDSSTFPYHYLNKILPWLMGFIVTMLLFDCISAERMNDSIKLLLTQPLSRSRYIISKVIAGCIHSVFVILSPMAVITLIYGMIDSLRNTGYPVLYLKNGFGSLKPIENYLEFDMINRGFNFSIGFSLYSAIPKGSGAISPKIGLMPLYRFMLLGLILVVLYILFMVIFNVFLSSLMKNKVIGFIASFLLTAAGIGISRYLLASSGRNISPFTMNNAVRILSGTYNVTPLGAVLVLCAGSLVLLIMTLLFFRKRNL